MYVSFCVGLIPGSICFQDLSMFVAWIKISFLFKAEHRPHLFIHSSVDRHRGCFHILAFVNNAAMNTGVSTYGWTPAFNYWGYILRSEIAASSNSVSFFDKVPYHFLQRLYQFILLPAVHKCSSFSTSFLTLYSSQFFIYNCCSYGCGVVSHSSFNLHFSYG